MTITKDKFVETANKRWKEGDEFLDSWLTEARDDYDFVSGNQWTDEDKALLEEQQRPCITFNYSEKMVDAVCGAEVSNRQEVTYRPREINDSGMNELWTQAAKWARDNCDAEDEETDAFRDCLICGIGATRTAMEYDEDPDGKIVVSRRDPLDCRYDPAARKPGLVDRRWDGERMWMDPEDARARWPDGLFVGPGDTDSGFTHHIQTGNRYRDAGDINADIHKDQVEIRVYECIEKETYYRVADGQQMAELSEGEFRQMKKQLDQFGMNYVRLKKKVYYRGYFSGEMLLEWGKSPCQDGFTLNFMTGKRDRNRNYWYGLTRVMKDPQRWANKWLSQILHIVNSNAKGGLMAEEGAFVDPRKAQDEWANPDSITLLREGALSGNKVLQKQMSTYPTGLDRLMEFALGSLPQVTGINLEALGLANREQANVLEQSRKQAAYGLLAPIFDALRRYRKQQGRVLLYFIDNYISDGRLIRIVGDDNAPLIPLTKAPDGLTYDVIVDQSPTAPDVKQRTWEQLMQIIPVMLKEGFPVPPELLQFSPLPTQLVTKWQQYIQQTGGVNPKQVQAMQQQMQELAQENQQLKQDKSIDAAEFELKKAQAEAEQQLKIAQAQAEFELEKFKAQADIELEQFKQSHAMEIENRRVTHDAMMQKAKVDSDIKVKAISAGIKPEGDGGVSLKLDSGDMEEALQMMAENQKAMMQLVAQMGQMQAESMAQLQAALTAPKRVVRDEQGRPVGVQTVGT